MLVGYALSIALLPYLCDLTARRDEERFGGVMNKTIRQLAFFFLPLTAATVALRLPVIDFVYNFVERTGLEKANLTANALGCYIFILYFYGLETALMQGFFSRKNTWWPVVTGFVASSIHIGFLYGALALGRAVSGENFEANVWIFYIVVVVYVLAFLVRMAFLLRSQLFHRRGYSSHRNSLLSTVECSEVQPNPLRVVLLPSSVGSCFQLDASVNRPLRSPSGHTPSAQDVTEHLRSVIASVAKQSRFGPDSPSQRLPRRYRSSQ